jgi:hypothetical protein
LDGEITTAWRIQQIQRLLDINEDEYMGLN